MKTAFATPVLSAIALAAHAQSPDVRSLLIEKITENNAYRVECNAKWNKLDPLATYEIGVMVYGGNTPAPQPVLLSRDNPRVRFTDINGLEFHAQMTGDGTITARHWGTIAVGTGQTGYYLHHRACQITGRNLNTGQHFPRTNLLDQQESQSQF